MSALARNTDTPEPSAELMSAASNLTTAADAIYFARSPEDLHEAIQITESALEVMKGLRGRVGFGAAT